MRTTHGKPFGSRIVGVRDAKAQLSRLLADVQDGGEWTITERGKPIARLVPFEKARLSFAERIRRLERDGTLEPEVGNRLVLSAPLPLPSGLAHRLLESDREARA
jgi:prevent-host-death family protein